MLWHVTSNDPTCKALLKKNKHNIHTNTHPSFCAEVIWKFHRHVPAGGSVREGCAAVEVVRAHVSHGQSKRLHTLALNANPFVHFQVQCLSNINWTNRACYLITWSFKNVFLRVQNELSDITQWLYCSKPIASFLKETWKVFGKFGTESHEKHT